MRYVGGKTKIAKAIADVIRQSTKAEVIVEPFIGGGSMTEQLSKRFSRVLASDNHKDIALLWQRVVDGWLPPEIISEREYYELMHSKPSALRGFVGTGGSFGGKWFAGYARGGFNSNGNPRNHQAESARAVSRIAKVISVNTTVLHSDYRDVEIPHGAAIYCDPPYADTLGYNSTFSTEEFWNWASEKSDSHDVFISEYRAPDDWVEIWNKAKRQSVTLPSQGREIRIERLFKRGY